MRRVGGSLASALLGAVLALGVEAGAEGEPYAVGARIAPLELADQHGVAHRVDETTRGVLLTRDMDGGGFVREALASEGAGQLDGAGAVYVADVSGMPALIRRMIALPRMRQRPYPVLLDPEGEPTARFPSRAGQVSWLRLEGLRIAELRFLTSAEEVRAALAAGTGPPGE